MHPFVLLSCAPALVQPTSADPQAFIAETRATLESRTQAYRAHVAAGKPRAEFKWDFTRELGRVNTLLAKPQPDAMKHALLVAELGYRVVGRQRPDTTYFESIRAAVPASSPAWGIGPFLLTELAENLTDEKAASEYLTQARTHSPVAEVRSYLLEQQFEDALEAKDETTWRAALAALEAHHGGSQDLETAHRCLEQYLKTSVGAVAPAFQLPSLDDPKTQLSLASFKGQYVLIDFWATWCSYCRLELPFLHRAWDRFQDKNFRICSLSFDQRPEDVVSFRRNRATPMPWSHAFVTGAKQNPVAQAYGVMGIPKAILVDPSGKIVATDGELKGKQLEKTLERFLGK